MSSVSYRILKIISISAITIGFIAGPLLISNLSYAVTVAGCDHVGTLCDINAKHTSKYNVFAPKIEVWSSLESESSIKTVNDRIDRKVTELNNNRNQAVSTLNTAITNARSELNSSIQRANQHTDQVREQIRNSLREELQNLLRAQTCENHLIPDLGTPGRLERVTSKLDCIKAALNNWRGVDAEGHRIVVTDGSALSREQVAQMLRSLELLLGDRDVTAAQRHFIVETMNQFQYFNLIPL